MVAPPYKYNDFSIHALLAESDHQTNAGSNESSDFLSTLSLRRATPMPCTKLITRFFLSTLSLRRATRCRPLCVAQYDFLSTLSLRRATLVFPLGIQGLFIFYPRSPCGERLKGPDQQHERHLFFYPRSPCGERRLSYAL